MHFITNAKIFGSFADCKSSRFVISYLKLEVNAFVCSGFLTWLMNSEYFFSFVEVGYTGYTWVCRVYMNIQGIHGYAWVYRVYMSIQGIHGYTGYTGYAWVYMGMQGIQGIYGYTWVYRVFMGIHGYTGYSWVYMSVNSLLLLYETVGVFGISVT